MDIRYSRSGLNLKNVALNVLCLYAMAYPMVAHCFMNGASSGSFAVQLFQALPILALAYLWRFRRKTNNLKNYVDVWTISIVYFTCASIYFALFYAPSDNFSEIVYAARFLSWFWLAATFRRIDLEPAFLERLAKSFWVGATSQCVLALWGTLFGLGNGLASTYSNVEATTGSADVSGKTVVAFVALGIALSVYWIIVKRGMKMVYVAAAALGVAVVLWSYNRASQLGLAVAYCFVFLSCVRKKRFSAAAAMLAILLIFGAFIFSDYGHRFTARWETIASDQGSGRVAMIEIAGKCVSSPPSTGVFWCGRGVLQMQEMMRDEIGSYIGMHNDFLDFTIVYGLVGAVLCVWVIYSVLNFRTGAPPASVENYFLSSTSVFVVLTGLCTGMFQATYVYFMLISLQYYFVSQARLKAFAWEQERLAELAWQARVVDEFEGNEIDDEDDWNGGEEYEESGNWNDCEGFEEDIDAGERFCYSRRERFAPF